MPAPDLLLWLTLLHAMMQNARENPKENALRVFMEELHANSLDSEDIYDTLICDMARHMLTPPEIVDSKPTAIHHMSDMISLPSCKRNFNDEEKVSLNVVCCASQSFQCTWSGDSHCWAADQHCIQHVRTKWPFDPISVAAMCLTVQGSAHVTSC